MRPMQKCGPTTIVSWKEEGVHPPPLNMKKSSVSPLSFQNVMYVIAVMHFTLQLFHLECLYFFWLLLIHSKHSRHYNFVQGPLVKMSKFYALHFPLIWTPWILFYFSSHGGIYMFGGKFNRYSAWGPGELRYSWLLNLGNGSWLRPVSTPVWVFAESFMLRACLHFSWHKKNNF